MSADFLINLSWLPGAPADFSDEVKRLADDHPDTLDRMRTLANCALSYEQLCKLDKALLRLSPAQLKLAGFSPFRLGMVSNGVTAMIAPALRATALRYGILLDVIEAPFDQAAQATLDAGSELYSASPDAVLVALDHRGLPFHNSILGASDGGGAADSALQYIDLIRDAIHKNSAAQCIFQTVARPPEPLFGSLDYALAGTDRNVIERFNQGLSERVHDSSDMLLDVAGIAETVGLATWHDPLHWHMAKLPFSQLAVPLYADYVGRLLAASRGKSRKCLVLDLDNTLWGGIIGDDGLEGIVLGQGSAAGEAFLEIQRTALKLRERGVILAVSSKNEEETARLPFREHPEMILSEDHIAMFQANWVSKSANLKAIAEALEIGADALVLLDDNPAERAQVRQALPEVAVPELPDDPALFSRVLLNAGYFESVAFSPEDSQRPEYYKANARRAAALEEVGDIDSYLVSLKMTARFSPFDRVGRARITQLINKTNQFNLTTRRYSETEVRELEEDPNCFTLQVRLTDTFGDNGMIGVVICRINGAKWEIDSWLMSCRVLGRRVEEAVLQQIVRHGREAKAERLTGQFIPTKRNDIVSEHYAKLDFELQNTDDGGTTDWTFDLKQYEPQELPLEIQSAGFGEAPT